jgi:hypothetical protein
MFKCFQQILAVFNRTRSRLDYPQWSSTTDQSRRPGAWPGTWGGSQILMVQLVTAQHIDESATRGISPQGIRPLVLEPQQKCIVLPLISISLCHAMLLRS